MNNGTLTHIRISIPFHCLVLKRTNSIRTVSVRLVSSRVVFSQQNNVVGISDVGDLPSISVPS